MSEFPVLHRLAMAAAPFGGCVSRALLASLGISYSHERSLVARGALAEVVPRVFVVGGAQWVTHEQLLHAGLLWAGGGGRLAGRSALAVRGVVADAAGEVWVARARPTAQGRKRVVTSVPVVETGRPGVLVVDTPRSVGSPELVRAWPVDGVARSLRQLAVDRPASELRGAWREADFLGLLDGDALRGEAGRGRPGSRRIREMLVACPPLGAGDRFRGRAEYLLLEALLAFGVPRPRVNCLVEVGGEFVELDFFFPDAALAVEVDGAQHGLPTRLVEDARRDAHLRLHGLETMRFSDAAVRAAADACAGVVAARRLERLEVATGVGAA